MLLSGATALEKELLACRIVFWLCENYRLGRSGSLAKEEVYGDYLNSMEPNKTDSVIVPTYFGKLVKKAFPSVRCNRKGPRGKAKQHYTHLQRVDHQREAERQRFNSFTEQAGPSATAPTATTSSSPGGPKHAPFQSYISSELSYLNYLLKKADPADRSGWVLSKPSSALNGREGRTDSHAAAGMPPAMTSVMSLGEAEADERDWDWVFVHKKPRPKKKQSPSEARKNKAHKRERDADSGSDEEAEGAEAKRRRSYAEDANGAGLREPSTSSREGHNGSGVWRSEVAGEYLQPQNFFTQFHHRTPSPSSSPSTSPSSPSPSSSPSSPAFRSTSSSSLYFPSSALDAQSLLPGRPRRHSSIGMVSPDNRDGETRSPPCPTAYSNDQPRQGGQCAAPEFFSSWHSLSSSSSPAQQSSSASLPSASFHSQLLSDINLYDYNQHQHQQHRSQQEPSYHHHQHHQRGGEVRSHYGQSAAVSNYPALPPKPQALSSAPMSYHTAGTYLDPQPTHTNPVLQSRALCGDEADVVALKLLPLSSAEQAHRAMTTTTTSHPATPPAPPWATTPTPPPPSPTSRLILEFDCILHRR